jgi:hypothetical protein
MVALYPALGRITERVAIKNSPLFDIEEAFRLFGDCTVEVLSLAGECKEVNIYILTAEGLASWPRLWVGSAWSMPARRL